MQELKNDQATRANIIASFHDHLSGAGADDVVHTAMCRTIIQDYPASDEIRQGCVNTSNPSARAMAARVIPAASAMRTASAVGADTDTITGAPIAALFCTISTETRLVRSMIPSFATTDASASAPESLSSAL